MEISGHGSVADADARGVQRLQGRYPVQGLPRGELRSSLSHSSSRRTRNDSRWMNFEMFQESTVKFHVVGLKCLNCGSYNTCRVKGSPSPGKDELLTAALMRKGVPLPDTVSLVEIVCRSGHDGRSS